MVFLNLSHPLEEKSPVYKGLKKPVIQPKSRIDKEGYRTYLVTFENHSGTHIEASGHFLENGKLITDYDPEDLLFKHPLIWDCSKNENEFIMEEDFEGAFLDDVDCLFIRTGFGKFREDEPEKYLTQNPGMTPETIQWIRKKYPKIRCLGLDCVSITGFQNETIGVQSHYAAFQEDKNYKEALLIVEDLNLTHSPSGMVRCVIIVPWQIKGVESAPCTVLARI